MKKLLLFGFALLFLTIGLAKAAPTTTQQAEKAVKGWLKTDVKPMGESLGKEIAETDVYNGPDGTPAYYIVYLNPTGFAIVSADDLIEPVVGFVTGTGIYDPSSKNPLGALVSNDLPGRIEIARKVQGKLDAKVQKKDFTKEEAVQQDEGLKAKNKWSDLHAVADTLPPPTGIGSISDVRVAPLVQSEWSQDTVCGYTCYNYYTPNNYVSGCVATAMAQLMRYWQYPTAGIGRNAFTIHVSGNQQTAYTLGGDGSGGPYNWSNMVLVPGCSITTSQRQAIGALCYDAGVAAHMQYSSSASGAYMSDAKTALVNTFMYSNVIRGGNESSNIGSGENDMINPNLDAAMPVLLGIYRSSDYSGHAVVADGYGYQSSTLYHHINMGWSGSYDAWYNLPNINDGYVPFDAIDTVLYNIWTAGSGEIISGRITSSGTPLAGVTVTATGTGGPYTATTNSNGIYALVKVHSNTTYTLTPSALGYTFSPTSKSVVTGTSADGQFTSGNRGGNDFTATYVPPNPPPAPASISYPASSSTGQYNVSWPASDTAASYQLERSTDSGASWAQVYSNTATSYAENVGDGSYRYRVKATNAAGSSDWTTGTSDCVVYIPPSYCSASGTNCDEYISGVAVGTINNTGTACSHYADYTALSTTMQTNVSYTVTVTNGHPYGSDQCGVWIDWNHDYDFDDPGEAIPVTGSPGAGPYTASVAVPANATLGNTTMRVRVTYTGTVSPCGTASYGEVEDYTINIAQGPCVKYKLDGFETGDFTALPWTNSGNANWVVTSGDKNSGTYSAKAGTIGNGQSTSLQLTITAQSGSISFYRKVSSELNYDWFRFYIDGVKKGEWSGTTQSWAQAIYPVTAGSRTFTWTYSKDVSSSSGSDTAWIDDIQIPVPCPPEITGDFDQDGYVDMNDLSILCQNWLTNNSTTDIFPDPNGDGITDLYDFAAFAQNWLQGTPP